MLMNDIIAFYICILTPLFLHFSNLILGNANDCFLSDNTIKKLVVPKKSFLRKLVIFKENKITNPPFLYTRIIPYLIQLFVVIFSTLLFFVNQFVISFIPCFVFMIVGYGFLVLNIVYELILFFLSQVLRL